MIFNKIYALVLLNKYEVFLITNLSWTYKKNFLSSSNRPFSPSSSKLRNLTRTYFDTPTFLHLHVCLSIEWFTMKREKTRTSLIRFFMWTFLERKDCTPPPVLKISNFLSCLLSQEFSEIYFIFSLFSVLEIYSTSHLLTYPQEF